MKMGNQVEYNIMFLIGSFPYQLLHIKENRRGRERRTISSRIPMKNRTLITVKSLEVILCTGHFLAIVSDHTGMADMGVMEGNGKG